MSFLAYLPSVPFICTCLLPVLVIYLIYHYCDGRNFRLAGFHAIPYVKGGYPFFGVVFAMVQGSPWDIMTEWARQYGGMFRLHLFGSDAVVISDPNALKIVLSTKLSNFKKDVVWTYKPFMVLLGRGLVTSEGEEWRRQRTLFSHKLRIDILEDIPSVSVRAVRRLSSKLRKICSAPAQPYLKTEHQNRIHTVEMAEEFRHLTLQVITEILFSLSSDVCDETLAHMYLPIVEEGNLRTWRPDRMYIPSHSWFKFKADVKVLNDFLTSIITTRITQRRDAKMKKEADILDFMLSYRGDTELSEEDIMQIRDEIKTFVLAGHETSASMLSWTLYELSIHPELMQRVQQEAREVFGSHFNDDEYLLSMKKEQLDRLVFTLACLKESLRKYSVVPTVVRIAEEDIKIGTYLIPKGMSCFVHMQGIHHDPHYWPDPMSYRPDRFLDCSKIEPFTFIPFIDGPRNCLGQHLSLLESKTVLALLTLRFKFELQSPVEAGIKHPFMVPIIPKFGHVMEVKELS